MSPVRVPRRTTKPLLFALLACLFWLSPSPAAPPAAAAGPYLYMPSYGALPGKLVVSNLDGTGPVDKGTLGGNLNGPTGIALDVKNQQMYIANYNGNTVIRANLDGTDPTPLNFGAVALDRPMGLALDLANGKIYVANYNANNIVKANLDGSAATPLNLGGSLNRPFGIVLDTYFEKMYVTSLQNGNVVSANLDGTSPTVLSFDSVTITNPAGIALDFASGKMYVTDFANNHLIQSYPDGSGAIDLGSLGSPLTSGASGIAVDHQNNKLYIMIRADPNGKLIQTDLDGGNATELSTGAGWGSGLLNYAYFVALDSPPDLSANLIYIQGSVPAGSGFTWRIAVNNSGANPAVFDAGQAILRDYLPAGPTYTVGTPQRYGVTSTGPFICLINASNVLNCAEGGGTASFAPGNSGLVISINALTHSVGTLDNPSGGMCRADPEHVTGETNTANNDCSSSVTVRPPDVARGQKMYVVNNGTDSVSRANLDGSEGTNLGNPGALLTGANTIALDLANEKMYVVSAGTKSIIRANLDGTGGTDLGNPGGLLDYPNGIALDVDHNWMYISNMFTNQIVRAHLDASGASVLANLTGPVSKLSSLALDLVHGRIYVTGGDSNNVYRLNLDGGGGTNLGNPGGWLDSPRGIAVDPTQQRVYVTSFLNHKVVGVNWDGTGVSDLGDLGGLCPGGAGIAVAANTRHIYVVCPWLGTRIVRANLDGSSPQDLGDLNNTLIIPGGIALDTRAFDYLPLLRR